MALVFNVDPERLLLVEYDNPGPAGAAGRVVGRIELVAIACGFVTAHDKSGERRVAFEVLVDPVEPHPTQPYACPRSRLARHLLSPQHLLSVKPYSP